MKILNNKWTVYKFLSLSIVTFALWTISLPAQALEPVGCAASAECTKTFSHWFQPCTEDATCPTSHACVETDTGSFCAATPTDSTSCDMRSFHGIPMSEVALNRAEDPSETVVVCANTTAQCEDGFCRVVCDSDSQCGGDFPVCNSETNSCDCLGECATEVTGCQSDNDCEGEYPKCNASSGVCECTWNSCETPGFGCNDLGFCECTSDECNANALTGELDFVPQPDVCRDLEASWSGALQITWIGLVPLFVPKMFPVKEVYLQVMCGLQPHRILPLVERGQGALLTVDDPNNPGLASVLDDLFPNFPRVEQIYIRGGGADKPVVVIMLAEGYNGPIFEMDKDGVKWEGEVLERIERYWESLPYEFLRSATEWLHDIALSEEYYAIKGTGALKAFLEGIGLSGDFLPTFPRAMAFPAGSWFQQKTGWHSKSVWVHELGHFSHYSWSGIRPFIWTDDFTSISRRNAHIGWCPFCLKIPFWFKQRYDEAKEDPADDELPYGYVSTYAQAGEFGPVEDFAETITMALASTNRLRDYIDEKHSEFSHYRTGGHRGYAPEKLYEREGDDAEILLEKANFIKNRYRFSWNGPNDADGNDITWTYGGADPADMDCDDANPVVQHCPEPGEACPDIPICAEGSTCFNQLCVEEEKLRISLAWAPTVDLDLHVRTPAGNVISSRNTVEYDVENPERVIGKLTRDACAQISSSGCVGSSSPHVENIIWTDPNLGEYEIWVVNYSGRQDTLFLWNYMPIPFHVEISHENAVQSFLGAVPSHRNTHSGIYSLSVQ